MTKPKFIRTKLALAKALEISRPTLDVFLGMKDAPDFVPGKGYPLAAVVDFIAENSSGEHQGKPDGSLREAKLREINLRCQRLQFRNDVERAKYVSADDIAAGISKIGGQLNARLFQRLVQELPVAVAGLPDVASVRTVTRNFFNSICDDFASLADLLPDETKKQAETPAA